MSRTGYIIRYAGSTIGWCSKLQIFIALSTAETQYINLSQALRTVILLVILVEELSDIFPIYINKPDLHCRLFENNESCIAMTESSNLSAQTKHITLKYHHLKSYADSKRFIIIFNCLEDQVADILTKPPPNDKFHILRKVLNDW